MITDWLPNLFIAGVPKAGTSSLHGWLAAHPNAFGSTDKETCFFVDPGSHIYKSDFNIINGLEQYRQQFPIPVKQKPKVILDSTPAYIYNKAALEHIPTLPGRPRCIFVLREPSRQILSLFNYFQNNWSWIPAGMSFAEYLETVRQHGSEFRGNELARDALQNADYLPWLRLWHKHLGDERMLVCTLDELKSDPRALVQRIAKWVDLDPSFYDTFNFGAENESYQPRSRSLQHLNIALRAHLPKGRIYRGLRGIYRQMNTRPPVKNPDIAPLLQSLSAEYAKTNTALAHEFGLDLSGWSGILSDQGRPDSIVS